MYRLRKGRRRLSLGAVVLVTAVVGAVSVLEFTLRPTIMTLSEAKARIVAVEAINDAVQMVIGGVEYRNLVNVRTDNQGRVVLLQYNSMEINRLATEAIAAIQNRLKQMSGERFAIPLGQVLGSKLFSFYGPRIWVNLVPIGTVQVKVKENVNEAGINQVRHMIYLEVKAWMKVVIPLVSEDIEVVSQIPVTEVTTIGEVPNTIINLNRDLLPGGGFGGQGSPAGN